MISALFKQVKKSRVFVKLLFLTWFSKKSFSVEIVWLGLTLAETAHRNKTSTSIKNNKDDSKTKTKFKQVYINARWYVVLLLPTQLLFNFIKWHWHRFPSSYWEQCFLNSNHSVKVNLSCGATVRRWIM